MGQQQRFDTVLHHVVAIELAHLVGTYLADESRLAAQLRNCSNRVCRRAACHHVFADRGKTQLDITRLLHGDKIHTTLGQVKLAQIVFRHLHQHVR